MSFNIGLRLNNLQYQINQKTGNPLTSDLNCAGFDINDAGIINYTSLNPPVSPSTQNINQTLTIGNNAGNLSIVDLSAVVFSNSDGVNEDIIFSQLPALGGRVNIYKESDIIDPFNSSATVAIGNLLASGNITAGGNLSVGASSFPSSFTLDGSFVLVNDGVNPGQCVLSCNTSSELVVSNGLRTTGQLTGGNLLATGSGQIGGNFVVGSAPSPASLIIDSSLIIATGGPAPKQITALSCDSSGVLVVSNGLRTTGNLSCNVLNYNSLSPPVGGGSVGTIQQVLTAGDNAGGEDLTNLDYLEAQTGSFIRLDGAGSNGLLQIGQWPANNWVDTIPPGTIGRLTLGNAELNMSNNYILNVPTPINTGDAVNKSYVDNYNATAQYINTGIPGPDAINANIPNTGAITTLYISPQITKPAGITHRLMITFQNKNILSGSSFNNVLTGLLQISNLGAIFTPSTIEPYGSGFLFGPSFLGWVEIPAGWTQYSYRIQASQTSSLILSYNLDADLMVSTFKS